MLHVTIWGWRGCVQGSGLSKYRNKLKNDQTIRRNLSKKSQTIFPVAMLLKGLFSGSISKYRNSETKVREKLENEAKIKKFVDNIFWLHLGRLPYLEVYTGPWIQPFQWYSNIKKQKCDCIVWLAFFYMQMLVKWHAFFKKCPIFSVFRVFLNKEWSMWHYCKDNKGATINVLELCSSLLHYKHIRLFYRI